MLLEGRRMIEDALDAGVRIEEMFLAREDGNREEKEEREEEDFLGRVRGEGQPRGEGDARGAAAAPAPRVTEVSSRVLRKLSDLPSTRGVVALASPPHRALESLSSLLTSRKSSSFSSSLPFFLILDDVQDPANVGAILRSGEAFGAAAALLTPGCAWPFSPRALRASAGSAFRLPVCAGVSPQEAILWARANRIALAGAEAHGGGPPEELAEIRPLAVVIGSEGHGISSEFGARLDHRATIPLAGRVESLNAAVAAGVLLHSLTRGARSPR
jgi:TrmH family RNA methyltransferase